MNERVARAKRRHQALSIYIHVYKTYKTLMKLDNKQIWLKTNWYVLITKSIFDIFNR